MDFLKCFLIFSVTWNAALLTLWKNIESSTPYIQVPQTTTNVAHELLEKMCEDAATVLARQAGWEYSFGEGVYVVPRATQLHLLWPEDRAGLLAINLDAECHLAVFGKREPFAKFCNKKLLSSFSKTWRSIGSMDKSNSNNWRFWRRLKKERTSQCICKNACSSTNDEMDLQLMLKNFIKFWTQKRERK